ncbi:MAG: ABC transporter ATP-binding protein [Caldilineaceae bacterium]|nr:ABC transporter ATP-binding protein [Caldilineaceae bacterium]
MIGGPRGLLEQEALKPKSVSATLRRFGRYFAPYWLVLIVTLVLMIGNAWVQVITPELLGQAVDCYFTPGVANLAVDAAPAAADAATSAQPTAAQTNCWFDTLPSNAPTADLLRGLGRLSLVLVGLYIFGSISGGLMFFMMSWSGQKVLTALRGDLFDHLQRLSLGFYSKHESGDLMSRITNDSNIIQQAISFALIQVVSGSLLIVWIAWVMLRTNFLYGLLSLAVVPLMALTTVWFSGQARKAFRSARREIGNVNAELEEGISGVREVQAFSREDANIESFRQSNAANRDANIRAVTYTSALAPTLEALGFVAVAIVAGVGGILMLRGQSLGGTALSVGLIVTYLAFVQRFNQPIQQISVLWTNIQSAIAGAERIFELLDEEPEIEERPGAKLMPPITGRVVFTDVTAEYNPDEQVLRGIDLVAEPGQTVAIVGPTGAGKTTLVNLIPRFYDVTGGSVTIDGVDVRDVTLHSLRSQIGLVLQDSFLFNDTVMNNIRFGRPDASDDEVIAAAKLAKAHDFIERLPEGYETTLGERGGGLSQGQRQLLSIARAALANPNLLILDEATSSVDTRTERQIQSALDDLLAGRTSFVIAHRLSTIRNADQVLVLKAGQIIERGTHEELLALEGAYHALYMDQFRAQEAVKA